MALKNEILAKIKNLPVCDHLDSICTQLKNSKSRFLILTAETAAGKSTGVPLALMEEFSGKILMLEPRRLAVFAIAQRIAQLKDEVPGKSVGYRVHLENKISRETRLEIITEAILIRQLQSDPSLEGVSVVILDEFHERSIHSDLSLAFLKEAMALRDDLFVIIMSATINTQKLVTFLGTPSEPAPVYKVPGRQFPVKIEYKESEVWNAIYDEAFSCAPGTSILAFFPGIADIRKCHQKLQDMGLTSNPDFQVMILHSSINLSQQKAVLSPVPTNAVRIILSSAIAESSLTVPGVSIVIDTGLCRINKMNFSAGLEKLETVPESEFSAEQRAGRAGRLGEGRCIRLWNKLEKLQKETPPEILRSELSNLVLECAQWGIFQKEKLQWLDAPSQAAWTAATSLLELLGCIKHQQITDLGKASLSIGLSPRLSCAAITGGAQLILPYTNFAESAAEIQTRFCQETNRRIQEARKSFPSSLPAFTNNQCQALLAGFPDRLAHNTQISPQNGQYTESNYQLYSGRSAKLKNDLAEVQRTFPEWIIVTEADSGEKEGIIYSFVPAPQDFINLWLNDKTTTREFAKLEGAKATRYREKRYGRIVLERKKLPAAPEDFSLAIINEVHEKGLNVLPLSDNAQELLIRTAFYRQQKEWEILQKAQKLDSAEKSGENQNAIHQIHLEAELQAKPEEWLLPFLGGKTKISQEDVYNALYWFLNGAEIDRQVPAKILLPNGKSRKIIYEKQSLASEKNRLVIRPVLEIIIQQIFGCFETPKVMGMPVLLRLLSPARRPLQITDDLTGFWANTWPDICKEMKGRYPKHNWNYKVVED